MPYPGGLGQNRPPGLTAETALHTVVSVILSPSPEMKTYLSFRTATSHHGSSALLAQRNG